MRFLLLFLWSLLFIVVNSCYWKMPVDYHCDQVIKYKVHDDKQALATCLEYFPTTFVEATYYTANNRIKCSVDKRYECNFITDSVSMFDKCYTFHKKEVTMKHYIEKRTDYCKDVNSGAEGGIPIFLTMTQAKHIAMKAHREGISKIWVNVNKEGKTIEKSGDMEIGAMLYKEPWKLYEGHYWMGDELKVTPINNEDKRKVPAPDADKVKYLFFRSKNDHWNNLFQGSFERATEDSTASIVCEYPAKPVPTMTKYCKLMGEKGLGMSTVTEGSSKYAQRCLYTTLTHYPLMGTEDAIRSFTGCAEKPSKDHSSGLFTGVSLHQQQLTSYKNKGTYRIAAIKDSTIALPESSLKYGARNPKHCDKTIYHGEDLDRQRQRYEIYDHFFNKKFAGNNNFFSNEYFDAWESGYPKDECTDFPSGDTTMHSNTLAIRDGHIIDVPTPVLFPAICSIDSNVDCKYNPKLCREDQFCYNVDEYDAETKHFAKCGCGSYHREEGGTCKWTDDDDACAMAGWNPCSQRVSSSYEPLRKGTHDIENKEGKSAQDCLGSLIVRNGCTITVWAHKLSYGSDNVVLLGPVGAGIEYNDVPSFGKKTLRGWDREMGASSYSCTCVN